MSVCGIISWQILMKCVIELAMLSFSADLSIYGKRISCLLLVRILISSGDFSLPIHIALILKRWQYVWPQDRYPLE